MNLTMNFHGIVRARVETRSSGNYTWQVLTLETARHGNREHHNPPTEKQEITIHPLSSSFNPVLPDTRDVEEAVKQLRALSQMLNESGDVDGEEHINQLISRLGYPITELENLEI